MEKEFDQDADVIFSACKQAVGYIGWEIVNADVDEFRVTAHTSISWRSFGDKVEIRVSDKDSSTIVTVSSEPRFSLTNWGKDSTNEGAFLEKLAQEIHRLDSR